MMTMVVMSVVMMTVVMMTMVMMSVVMMATTMAAMTTTRFSARNSCRDAALASEDAPEAAARKRQ